MAIEPEWAVDLDDMIEALQEEIRAGATSDGGQVVVTDGRLLHESDEGALYSFRASRPLGVEPDTPLLIEVDPMGQTTGRLAAEADFDILIHADENLGEHVPEAAIKVNAGFIFSRLIERLDDLVDEVQGREPGELVRSEVLEVLVSPRGGAEGANDATDGSSRARAQGRRADPKQEELYPAEIGGLPSSHVLLSRDRPPNEGQLRALAACADSPLHFVWGPPGTGKTATLAQVVRYLAAPLGEGLGHRVLVLAHANAAVDVAAVALAAQFAGTNLLAEGRVCRWGAPQLPEVWALPEIQPLAILERSRPELVRRVRALAAEQARLVNVLRGGKARGASSGAAEDLRAVSRELKEVRRLVRVASLQILTAARVVATTLSRFILEEELYRGAWDTAVVDEASMAPLPMVIAACLHAGCKSLVFGDFRQLPPIHRARTPLVRRWLSRDAFEAAGITQAVDRNGHHPRLNMLDTQYRMAPPICSGVGRLAYMGRLRTAAGVADRTAPLVASAPWPEESVLVLDTSQWAPVCAREVRPNSYSRFNPLHALVAAEVAHAAARAGLSVGLMSAYRAQALLMQACADQEPDRTMADSQGPILSATVHRFQGSERDLVLFDVTDAPPESGASYLTGREPDTSLRLCTVALSRARAKSIILIDRSVLAEAGRSLSPLGEAVSIWREEGSVQELAPLVGTGLSSGTGTDWLSGWCQAKDAVVDDLETWGSWAGKGEGSLVLNLPAGFALNESFLAAVGRAAVETPGATHIFATPDHAEMLDEVLADVPCDLRLLPLHAGLLVFLGREVVYVGGRDSAGPVARVTNRRFADRLRRLVGLAARQAISPAVAAAGSAGAPTCPSCGSDMVVRRERGSWVASCPQRCGTSVALDRGALDVVLRNMKLVCPICGSPLVVRGTGRGMFAACPRYRRGCDGFTVPLVDLLGG